MVHLMAVCMGKGMAKGMQKGKDVKQELEQDHERDPEQVEVDAAGDDAEWCMELARKNAWAVHDLMMASSRTRSRERADEPKLMPPDCGVPTQKVEEEEEEEEEQRGGRHILRRWREKQIRFSKGRSGVSQRGDSGDRISDSTCGASAPRVLGPAGGGEGGGAKRRKTSRPLSDAPRGTCP